MKRLLPVACLALALAPLAGPAGAPAPRGDYPLVFTEVTRQAGLLAPLAGMMGHGAAWGDFDGDGRPDLYLMAMSRQHDNLFVAGLTDGTGGHFPTVDLQTRLIARFIKAQGAIALPAVCAYRGACEKNRPPTATDAGRPCRRRAAVKPGSFGLPNSPDLPTAHLVTNAQRRSRYGDRIFSQALSSTR